METYLAHTPTFFQDPHRTPQFTEEHCRKEGGEHLGKFLYELPLKDSYAPNPEEDGPWEELSSTSRYIFQYTANVMASSPSNAELAFECFFKKRGLRDIADLNSPFAGKDWEIDWTDAADAVYRFSQENKK